MEQTVGQTVRCRQGRKKKRGVQPRQLDRTLKGTRDARVTKRRDTRGFDGAQTRREELGSIFTVENNQGGGGSSQPLRFHKIKPAGDNSRRICCFFHHARLILRLRDAGFNWRRPQSEAFTEAVAVKLRFPPLLPEQLATSFASIPI